MPKLAAAGEIWSDAMNLEPGKPLDWIWEGFIAPSNLTLLTSQWKSGKTTLLSILLGLRVSGGVLGGMAVRPGKTLVVSEEPMPFWHERSRKHQFGGSVCFIPQPFRTIPTPQQWQELIERALVIKKQHGVDLIVIDPLAPFLRNENQARSMLETLLPLGQLLQEGMAVTLLHHPGRGERALGQAARGSGALLGHVDVSIEMRHPGGDPLTRRRRLFTLSRHTITPRQLVMELDEAGTTYKLITDTAQDPFKDNWEPIRRVLAEAPQKLTREDILMEWPEDFERPARVSVWRVLDTAVEQGLVQREGGGKKSDPYRYWMAERVEIWKQDPLYAFLEAQKASLKLPFESRAERKEKLRQVDGADG